MNRTLGAIARTARVLIVDDELPIRILLTRMVTNWGYAVKHCEGAVEALNVMAAEPADILLCDVAMPEYDGVRLAAEVHARWPHTAVIMCTGRQDAPTVQMSRRAGAVAYVTKPFNPYLLREALDRASELQTCAPVASGHLTDRGLGARAHATFVNGVTTRR